MRKKIFIHCGAHKTASSLIQNCLKLNEENIQRENSVGFLFRKEMLTMSFYKELKNDNFSASSQAIEEMQKLIEPFSSFIITNEDLFSGLAIERFFPELPRNLAFFSSLFSSKYELTYILYTRNQADYLESAYLQNLHMGRNISFHQYINNAIPTNINWHMIAKCLEESGALIKIKPYESILIQKEELFFQDFLTTVQIPNENKCTLILNRRTSNRSFSKKAVEIFFRVRDLLNYNELSKLRNFLQTNFSTADYPKAHFFNEEQRQEIKQIYQSSNQLLFDDYLTNYEHCKIYY